MLWRGQKRKRITAASSWIPRWKALVKAKVNFSKVSRWACISKGPPCMRWELQSLVRAWAGAAVTWKADTPEEELCSGLFWAELSGLAQA